MKIAVEGCAHGELDKIYGTIEEIEAKERIKIDLLLCCGDFQSTRNLSDLKCMAVPDKYKEMGDFYKYYSGQKKAPVLTIFIGGNHEASTYLQELPFGGWVAPNIYYLGYAGVVQVNGLRIAGLSGIYKSADFHRGRFEASPYSESSLRSVYHTRNLDVFRLKQLRHLAPDIVLTHDWPNGIHKHGDLKRLLQMKPFLRDDIENDRLGSDPSMELLQTLKPSYWFSAHLHVKFPAVVEHEDGSCTKFLALDKCLPRRHFLQILTIEPEQATDASDHLTLSFDPAWLAVLRSTNHLTSVSTTIQHMPGPNYTDRWDFSPNSEEIEAVRQMLSNNLCIPTDAEFAVDAFDPEKSSMADLYSTPYPRPRVNPQTQSLCTKLLLDDPIHLLAKGRVLSARDQPQMTTTTSSSSSTTASGESPETAAPATQPDAPGEVTCHSTPVEVAPHLDVSSVSGRGLKRRNAALYS